MSLRPDSDRSLDSCDLIDVLEEAVLRKTALTVWLQDGRTFTDHVQDVVTEGGANYAVFRTEGRLDVKALRNARAVSH